MLLKNVLWAPLADARGSVTAFGPVVAVQNRDRQEAERTYFSNLKVHAPQATSLAPRRSTLPPRARHKLCGSAGRFPPPAAPEIPSRPSPVPPSSRYRSAAFPNVTMGRS